MDGMIPSATVIDEWTDGDVMMAKTKINAEETLRNEARDILARGASHIPFNWLRFDEENFLKRETASKVGAPRSALNRANNRAKGKKARTARRKNR